MPCLPYFHFSHLNLSRLSNWEHATTFNSQELRRICSVSAYVFLLCPLEHIPPTWQCTYIFKSMFYTQVIKNVASPLLGVLSHSKICMTQSSTLNVLCMNGKSTWAVAALVTCCFPITAARVLEKLGECCKVC